jgi:menaquinone-9 beta-reductase
MRERLSGAEPLQPRPLAISPIPYGYLTSHWGGLWRVGDQAAVIPSFTGDGMSIALHTAALAAEMYLDGKSGGEYIHMLRSQLMNRMRLATSLSRTMVTAPGRAAALAVLSTFPHLIRWIAAATRVPNAALLCGCGALRPPALAFFEAAQPSPPRNQSRA